MDQLLRPFQLALFLHHDETIAMRVALAALMHLEAAVARQEKRFYHRPKLRRNRIVMPPAPLLQYLVFRESESHEKCREDTHDVKIRDQDRLVWFLEYLVRISMRRSAFHVAVGVCRLLYHYSTREVLAIYDVMAQSSACGPQDDTCRATKKLLLDKVAERFAPRLEIRRESRGERRITTRRTCPEDVALVQEALVRFTPWDTACGVPESFDPLTDPLPALCPPGREPDQTHEVETRRIHAILHPPCLERVTAALGLAAPAARLRIPCFNPR